MFILAALLGIVICLLLAGALAKARLKAAYPPSGQLIDVGGYKLHTVLQGEGQFTVVFDSGVGGIAAHWEQVQPEIAKHAVTLAYDRAGLGWSEPGKQPRSFEAMADELQALLEATNVPAPYILVGHSFGGVVARQFAKAHPDQVAGIVLVDSAFETQFTERFPAEVRNMSSKMVKGMKPMIWAFASGIPALFAKRMPLTPGLSAVAAQAERAARVFSGTHMRAALAEMDAIVHHPPQPIDTLGNIPLVVLSHGVAQPVPNLSAEVNAAYEEAWQQMQRELARLSSSSEHIIARDNGHDIHLENPRLVIESVQTALHHLENLRSPAHA